MKNTSRTKTPPQTTSSISSSFKYLRRTLYLNPANERIIIKLNLKRIHIRKILEKYASDDSDFPWEIDKRCLKRKLFKGLTSLQIDSLHGLYWIEDLKNSKSLAKFTLQPGSDCKSELLLKYLRRLNKNIAEIDAKTVNFSMKQHFKTIRKFSNLKAFHTKTRLEQDFQPIKQELQYRKRYLSRMNSLSAEK